MSRVASNPITVPASVEVNINGQHVAVKGPKGAQEFTLHKSVEIIKADNVLTFKERAEVLNTRRHSGESRNSAATWPTFCLSTPVTTISVADGVVIVMPSGIGYSTGCEKPSVRSRFLP